MTTPQEIWTTRLQREILALVDESNEKKDIGILPAFINYHKHDLDIARGTCSVSFAITVEGIDRAPTSPLVDKGLKAKVDAALGEEDNEEQSNTGNDDESTKTEETDSTQQTSNISEPSTYKAQIIVMFDASRTNSSSTSYPFSKPKAILTSGAEHFNAIKINNGDQLYIDCDWTPSLHLNDAALNIALKIRESIKRSEPCLKIVGNASENQEDDLLQEVRKDISKAGAKVSSFLSDLKSKASAVAEELDHAVGSGASGSSAEAVNTSPPKAKRKVLKFPRKEKARKPESKIVTLENIAMGDEIDLATEPWNTAVGMYPCNAIRRPAFVASAMEASGQNNREKVATAGLGGASSMFRSFTKSAKSVLEESFLMLTEELIIEIRCNKFSVASATVSFAIPVSHLAKLKFRREESLSLFFKQAPDDPIIYMCISSAEAVKQIQNILKKHGVKGKHTNATMQKAVQSAVEMIEAIKSMEKELQEDPTPLKEKVTFIMDLYRQAAEKFELAGDARHEEAMSHMRDFLAKPLVASILDGSFEKKEVAAEAQVEPPEVQKETTSVQSQKEDVSEPLSINEVPETATESAVHKDEIIQESSHHPDDVDEEIDEDMEKAMKAAETMLQDAHKDLEDLGIDDFEDDDRKIEASVNQTDPKEVVGDDVISEFEDMLKDADKELEELMGS